MLEYSKLASYCISSYEKDKKPDFVATPTDSELYVFREGDDVILCVQGSSSLRDWIVNFLMRKGPDQLHDGWQIAARLLMPKVLYEILGVKGTIYLTGHSSGGAVAQLLADFLLELGLKPVCVTFAAPRIGKEVKGDILNVNFEHWFDIVPHLPFGFDEGESSNAKVFSWCFNPHSMNEYYRLT